MQFKNYTPFPAIAWENVDSENRWYVTTVARVRLKFHATSEEGVWELRPDPEQGVLFGEDEFYGETGRSSVRYESDFVSYKPNTDVVVNASARAPLQKPWRSWYCGVRVLDERGGLLKEHELEVLGEKASFRAGLFWVPSFRQKAYSVPIRYEKAYGGTVMIPPEEEEEAECLKVDIYNPVGCGIKKVRDPERRVDAPQVRYAFRPEYRAPAGLGFIGKSWESRLRYAGTYDDAWLKNQHPLPPHDFDERFNQAAHPELVMDGYLRIGTSFELTNLMSGPGVQRFRLPLFMFYGQCEVFGGMKRLQKLSIDTVVIDVDDADDMAVYASWRIRLEKPEKLKAVHLHFLPLEHTADAHG